MTIGLMTLDQARLTLAGAREFDQWLGITSSNKTFLWLVCMVVIGLCIGYLVYKIPKKLKSKGGK